MVEASSSVGTTFSRLASTMWIFGRVCVRSPLPSLVTMIVEPVSAMRKLAPVMPTSAARNFGRRIWRASSVRVCGSLERARRIEIGVGGAERIGDLLLQEMDRRRDDMARRLVAELDDVFAEIGLDRLDLVLLEEIVERDLLGDHRLALGHGLGVDAAADPEDGLARLRRRCGTNAPGRRARRPSARSASR